MDQLWEALKLRYSCFRSDNSMSIICGHTSIVAIANDVLEVIRALDPDKVYGVEASYNPEHASGYVTVYKRV